MLVSTASRTLSVSGSSCKKTDVRDEMNNATQGVRTGQSKKCHAEAGFAVATSATSGIVWATAWCFPNTGPQNISASPLRICGDGERGVGPKYFEHREGTPRSTVRCLRAALDEF